jgi:hypothetical protein
MSTPGPWVMCEDPVDTGHAVWLIEAHRDRVADVFDEADARLIAAAPEMLAALESSAKFLTGLIMGHLLTYNGTIEATRELKKIDALIAKAEGK